MTQRAQFMGQEQRPALRCHRSDEATLSAAAGFGLLQLHDYRLAL